MSKKVKQSAKPEISINADLDTLMDRANADERFDVRTAVCEVLWVLDLVNCRETKIVRRDGVVRYRHLYSPTHELERLMEGFDDYPAAIDVASLSQGYIASR